MERLRLSLWARGFLGGRVMRPLRLRVNKTSLVEYVLSEMSPDFWVEMKKDGLKIDRMSGLLQRSRFTINNPISLCGRKVIVALGCHWLAQNGSHILCVSSGAFDERIPQWETVLSMIPNRTKN